MKRSDFIRNSIMALASIPIVKYLPKEEINSPILKNLSEVERIKQVFRVPSVGDIWSHRKFGMMEVLAVNKLNNSGVVVNMNPVSSTQDIGGGCGGGC